MNTDTTDNGGNQLQGAFGDRGTNVNSMAYGHPHAEKIMSQAREVLMESPTGTKLLNVLDVKKVPLMIMKGKGESGFSPDMMSITLLVPGNIKELNADILVAMIKALREAAQEIGGFKTPDPRKDVVHYAEFIHARNLESVTFVCKIVKELTNSSYFSVLLDSLKKLGLNSMYKAYLDGASKEELYMKYAEAYNSINRGSI